MYLHVHVHVAMTEREALCTENQAHVHGNSTCKRSWETLQRTKFLYTIVCLHTSLHVSHSSVPGFNINWSAKIAKVHYTIPFLQKGTCQTDND